MSRAGCRKPGRPAHKRESIAGELCRRITVGEWQPGDRVPTQAEMEELFDAGNPTIQQALNVLTRAGFLEARGNRGTFVVQHPPHLSRYGLVFPGNPYHGWSRLWEALRHAAGLLEHRNGGQVLQFPLFYNIDEHADSPDYRALLGHLRLPSIGGMIFANVPWNLSGTPLLTQAGLPRVAIAEGAAGSGGSQIPARYPGHVSFYQRALDFLVSPAGGSRRRPALVCFQLTPERVDFFQREVAARGAVTRACWMQAPMLSSPTAIRHAVQLLFQGLEDERPDSLIIADDNFVEHATQGLVQAGVRTPREVTTVAFCNFPTPPPSAVPLTWLGFDACALLDECVDCLAHQRRGEPVEPVRLLSAVFEKEATVDWRVAQP